MFPAQGFLQPGLQDDGMVMLVITSTQKITFPAGVSRVELWLQGGGASSSNTRGGQNELIMSGNGGACAVSSIAVSPSVEYTVIIGAASSVPDNSVQSYGVAGNDSMFVGAGLPTIIAQGGTPGNSTTQAVALNAQLSIPGEYGMDMVTPGQILHVAGGSVFGGGGRAFGTTVLCPSNAYGSGGHPPSSLIDNTSSALPGNPGRAGVAVIRYKGKV